MSLDGMKFTTFAKGVALLAVVPAFVFAQPPWYRDRVLPKDEASCRAASGEWSKTPFFQTPFCRITYPDGGKQCARASDCQSLICVVENSEQRSGTCHGQAERFATFWYLDETGKVEKISVE